MAITTYTELQTAISNWMDRSDIGGADEGSNTTAKEIISLAEAGLNRELEAVEADATLTGTIGSRSIDISSYSVIEGIALFILREGDEYRLTQKAEGSFPQTTDEDEPSIWALDGDNIDFNCELDEAYTFRFRYRGRFALSDSASTNDLLTNHPDVYLGACLVWGGLYIQSDGVAARWESALNRFVARTRNHLAQRKRGTLTVDPSIARLRANRRGFYNGDEL
jgi:hypothetical protein